jgi:hypothetical protein
MTNPYVWEKSKNKPEGFFDMSLLLRSILFLCTVASGLTLVLERQTHLQWDNRTIAYNRLFVGGCCNGDQDSTYGYSPNCKPLDSSLALSR